MTPPSGKACVSDTCACSSYSFAACPERISPTPIENASTKIRTTPVRRIDERDIPAAATPERSPTVDTKLSSTPKIKLRTREGERNFFMWTGGEFLPAGRQGTP